MSFGPKNAQSMLLGPVPGGVARFAGLFSYYWWRTPGTVSAAGRGCS